MSGQILGRHVGRLGLQGVHPLDADLDEVLIGPAGAAAGVDDGGDVVGLGQLGELPVNGL